MEESCEEQGREGRRRVMFLRWNEAVWVHMRLGREGKGQKETAGSLPGLSPFTWASHKYKRRMGAEITH